LLRELAQGGGDGGAAAEVALLVAAHRCLALAADAEAAAALLSRVRQHAYVNLSHILCTSISTCVFVFFFSFVHFRPALAHRGEFRLLVQLYTGLRAYAQLAWLLDLLVRHDRFELLLGKRVSSGDDAPRLRTVSGVDKKKKRRAFFIISP
jgi:hypothetical protein